jgi:hypothetical protein
MVDVLRDGAVQGDTLCRLISWCGMPDCDDEQDDWPGVKAKWARWRAQELRLR